MKHQADGCKDVVFFLVANSTTVAAISFLVSFHWFSSVKVKVAMTFLPSLPSRKTFWMQDPDGRWV